MDVTGVTMYLQCISKVVSDGVLKPVKDLRVTNKDHLNTYHDGYVFVKVPRVLKLGHALNRGESH